MQTNTSQFTTSDGFKIHTINWQPETETSPKAVVILVHGIAEHSGRYAHVAEKLVNEGYVVYSFDHRGHGHSEGVRGYFDSFEQPVSDLEAYFKQIKATHPDTKIFLIGHSMGSLLTTMFTLRHQDELAGWVSSGSPLTLDETVPSLLISIGKALQGITPKLPFAGLDPNAVSRDPATVQEHATDPLIYHGRVRVAMGIGIITHGQIVRESLNQLQLPILIMHGTGDTIAPPSGSKLLMERAGSEDKTLKLYDGLYHEIFNELERETVLADLLTWLNAH